MSLETKTVKLPSGLEVEIRKPGGLLLLDIASMAADKRTANGEGLDEAEVRAIFRMIRRASVKPKFTDAVDEHGDPVQVAGKTHVDELDPVDVVKLAQEIREFSGIEDMEERLRPLSATKSD